MKTVVALLPVSLLLGGCEDAPAKPPQEVASKRAAEPPPDPGPATYVGRASCAECHAAEVDAHAGSQHDRAMQEATPANVAAPFTGEELAAKHLKARFVQRDGAFIVEAEGRSWPVKWTFGVEPLQQYLVEAAGGRLQAFPAPFDTRAREVGGQHWYMQPELDVPADDALHWQGVVMNWNQTCADCHSTHVQLGYRLAQDRYDTRFAEPDVSCEACHGPASRHVELARRAPVRLADTPGAGFGRRLVPPGTRRWVRAQGEPIAHLEGVERVERGPAHVTDQLDACARCHSRRNDLGGDSLRYHDRYRLQWIEEPYYFPDGQIRDEVYVYGSFLQSKMARAGVTCSDCHDPHSAQLRAEPRALCAQCHDPAHYDAPSHHMHASSSEQAPGCVDCHMPERTYMGIDARRDHRLGVPRPDLGSLLETPNACVGCHEERDDRWAAAVIERAHGPSRPVSPWPVLRALESAPGEPAVRAVAALVGDGTQAPVVRASALVRWSRALPASPALEGAIEAAARSVHPLLRRAAAEASAALPPPRMRAQLAPLWRDARRIVRLEAAMTFLQAGASLNDGPPAFAAALREARAAHEANAGTVQGLLALASVELALGETAAALRHHALAAARFPQSPMVFANWADALRHSGDEVRAGEVLEQGLSKHADSAALHHARGLWLVRNGRRDQAVGELRRAVELADDASRARFEYVYEVAKQQLGTPEPAPSAP